MLEQWSATRFRGGETREILGGAQRSGTGDGVVHEMGVLIWTGASNCDRSTDESNRELRMRE